MAVSPTKDEVESILDKKVIIFPPHIPIEILRYILELATTLDRKATARSIVLASKLLRTWIDPFLYRDVVLHTAKAGEIFVAAIKARKERDPTFFGRRVKYLTLTSQIVPSDMDFALSSCTGLSHLSLLTLEDSENETAHISPTISSLSKLTHFSCYFIDSIPEYPIKTLAPSITHLTLCYEETIISVNWTDLFAHCPRITHLLVCFDPETRSEITDFLASNLPARLAESVRKAHPESEMLSLVFVPVALLVGTMLPVPREWTPERKPEYLFINPRRLIEDISDEEIETILKRELDREDMDEADETPTFGYLASRFPLIESEIWSFAEEISRSKPAPKKETGASAPALAPVNEER